MGVLQIISAILLILACVFIVGVVLMQDTKQGMSQTITGGNADNYYQKNVGRTKEAKLNKLTKVAAVVFFVVTLLVNVTAIYFSNEPADDAGSDTSINSGEVIEGSDVSNETEASATEATTSEASATEATTSEASATETSAVE